MVSYKKRILRCEYMKVICSEHAESRCDCYPHSCYGCNAFVNPTNFDRIKHEILQMNMEEFIKFCRDECCGNIICGHIPVQYAYCANKNPSNYDKSNDCYKCIREYLKRKPDDI